MPQSKSDFEKIKSRMLPLEAINASMMDAVSHEPDECTTQEQVDIQTRWTKLSSYIQDTSERKKYAKRAFGLTCIWISGIYILLVLQGFTYKGFHLSESVLLAAIGSTTANVIGVFLIVTRYFFPNKH